MLLQRKDVLAGRHVTPNLQELTITGWVRGDGEYEIHFSNLIVQIIFQIETNRMSCGDKCQDVVGRGQR